LKGNPTKAAVFALCEEMERLESRWPSDLGAALDSQWFRRAVAVLMDEANRSADEDYARLLGRVAAYGCLPAVPDAHRREDLASYIRDLARLGEDDIHFLKLLREVYQKVEVGSHVGYSSYYKVYQQKADEAGFEEDDRIALGIRLSGFGLAMNHQCRSFQGTTSSGPQSVACIYSPYWMLLSSQLRNRIEGCSEEMRCDAYSCAQKAPAIAVRSFERAR
jgi:hypothetical protein